MTQVASYVPSDTYTPHGYPCFGQIAFYKAQVHSSILSLREVVSVFFVRTHTPFKLCTENQTFIFQMHGFLWLMEVFSCPLTGHLSGQQCMVYTFGATQKRKFHQSLGIYCLERAQVTQQIFTEEGISSSPRNVESEQQNVVLSLRLTRDTRVLPLLHFFFGFGSGEITSEMSSVCVRGHIASHLGRLESACDLP